MAPETAVTATMLMTFVVTIDISDAVCSGRRLVFAVLRLDRELFFADISSPMAGQAFAA
jgi:hypothetical protein